MYNKNEPSIIQIHAKEVSRFPVLSHDEESQLAAKAAAGDKAARDKILTSNMRFVIKIAKQYLNRGMEFEDLISEGYIGLIEAINRYEVSKGYHFLSYAVWWIRQSILKALYDKVRPIRLPANKTAELLQIDRAKRDIKTSTDEYISEEKELEKVAEKLGMTNFHVREMINISSEMTSLNSSGSGDADGELIDSLVAEYETPEEEYMNAALKNDLNKALDTLDVKSSEILKMRYGLCGTKEKSLQEIGSKFNLSKERIRQIEKKSLMQLQSKDKRVYIEDYIVA